MCRKWWDNKDSNLGPSGYEPPVLPTELSPQIYVAFCSWKQQNTLLGWSTWMDAGADSGTWTHTIIYHLILSQACLPFHHIGVYGANNGNRTRDFSLGNWYFAIKLYLHVTVSVVPCHLLFRMATGIQPKQCNEEKVWWVGRFYDPSIVNNQSWATGPHLGSRSWARTNDPTVNSRMLYQLSYARIYCRSNSALSFGVFCASVVNDLQ